MRTTTIENHSVEDFGRYGGQAYSSVIGSLAEVTFLGDWYNAAK